VLANIFLAESLRRELLTVYEVGQTDDQVYFSMQYVEGQDLAEILHEGPLDERRAAGYLEPVARAVHQSHFCGVLHRDLKPQNVLVERQSDRPLVTDFGLAKLSAEQSTITREGETMETPQYMPPEQTCDASRVTEKSDVYSLGATLYHLVTGRPPFQAATIPETMRQVLMEEPVSPRQLNTAISADLETICLKCLEKDPLRRYPAAAELADDLNREPIQARPLGRIGRLQRWCWRNPLLAATIGAAVGGVLIALAASLIGYVKVSDANEKTMASFRHAREAVKDFYTYVSEEQLLNEDGMQPLRRALLKQALVYNQRFLGERSADPSMQYDVAESHFLVGSIQEDIAGPAESLEALEAGQRIIDSLTPTELDLRARELLGNLLNAKGRVLLRLGQLDESEKTYHRVVDVRRTLTNEFPDVGEYQRKLANAHMNLGLFQERRGRPENALEEMTTAQELRRELLDENDKYTPALQDLALGSYNLANFHAAERNMELGSREAEASIQTFERLVELEPDDHQHQYRFSLALQLAGDLSTDIYAAVNSYTRSLELMQSLAGRNPTVRKYRNATALLGMNIGQLRIELKDWDQAMAAFGQSQRLWEELLDEEPAAPIVTGHLAVTLKNMAVFHQHQQRPTEAMSAAKHAQKLFQELIQHDPQDPELPEKLKAIEDLLSELAESDSASVDST